MSLCEVSTQTGRNIPMCRYEAAQEGKKECKLSDWSSQTMHFVKYSIILIINGNSESCCNTVSCLAMDSEGSTPEKNVLVKIKLNSNDIRETS